MIIIFLIFFCFGILMTWFHNRFICCDILGRPAWFHGRPQMLFAVVRHLIVWGSVVGIGFTYNLTSAVIAGVLFYAFTHITFEHYFNREVRTLEVEFLKDASKENSPAWEMTRGKNVAEWAHENALAMIWGNITDDPHWYWNHRK